MANQVLSKNRHKRDLSFRDVASILEKNACVLCSMLKRFHSTCIQQADINHIQALCDFHAWAIAGGADSGAAARILLRLLLLDQQQLLPGTERCSVCLRVAEEEIKHSDKFLLLLETDPQFQDWMRNHGAVCIPHARRLLKRTAERNRQVILALLAESANRLKSELRSIADNKGNRRSSIVLSQAAEFLKGRRGLANES